MDYTIIKPINNNVVLVCNDKTKEQVILMSKGIGFNQKAGNIISDKGEDKQIFKLWSGEEQLKNVDYDKREVETLVKDIVKLAKGKLSIKSDGLYEALLDHIIFAIDRLCFGLPIENPFVNEISIFYNEEYEVAQIAIDMIKKKINVDMGKAEAGFIALHLHSARKNSTLQLSIENVRIYNKVVLLLTKYLGKEFHTNSARIRAFLLSLDNIIMMCKDGKALIMPSKNHIFEEMADSYQIARLISDLIKKEMNISISADALAFVTVDIEKLRQV